MKKDCFKRPMALILALAMMISLLPAIAVAAEEDIVLEFNKSMVSNAAANAAVVTSAANWQIVPERTTNGNLGAFNSTVRIAGYVGTGTAASNVWLQNPAHSSNRGMFTVKSKIPAGNYKVSFAGGLINIAGMVGIYVDGQYVGVYDCYDTGYASYASAPVGDEKTLGTVAVTPDADGYAEVSFVLAAASDGKTPGDGMNEANDLMLSRLTLSPVESLPTVSEVEIDMDGFGKLSEGNTVTLLTNQEASFTVRARMSDGTYKELNGFAVDFAASPRKVTDDFDNAFSASVEGSAVEYTQTSNFKSSYAMYATGGQFGGKLKGLTPGEATLTATATIGGEPYTKTVNIKVSDEIIQEPVTLEFSNKTISGNRVSGTYISAHDWEYFADNWEPVLAETTAGTTNIVNATGVRLTFRPSASKLGWGEIPAANRISMQFTAQMKDFIAPGYYSVRFTAPTHSTAGKMFVYVGGEYAGAYEAYEAGASDKPGEEVTLNTVYLSGKPKVMFALGEQTGGTYGTFYKVHLEPVEIDALAYEKLGHNVPESIYKGDSTEVRIAAALNDGSEMHYNGYKSDASADTSDAIEVSVEGTAATLTDVVIDDGIIKGTLTGVELGEGKIKVSGKYNDTAFEGEIPLKVKEAPKLKTVELAFAKASVPATRTTTTSLTLTRNDGEAYTDTFDAVWESSNEDVATVDGEGNITAVSKGTSVIKATVTAKDGTVVSVENTITVTAEPVLASISATAENDSIPVGGETQINATGKMDDGIEASAGEYTFVYESTNTDIADVDENGKVTAKAAGTAKIIISAAAESGKSVFATVSVTVTDSETDRDIVLSYNSATVQSSPDGTGCQAAIVAEGGNWKIIPERSTKGALSAYSKLIRVAGYVGTGNSGHTTWLDTPSHASNRGLFSVKTKVPAGTYQVKFIGGLINIAGMVGIYVDGQYVGVYDCYDTGYASYASAPLGDEKTLGTVTVTPDEDGYAEINFVLAAASDGKTPGDGMNEATDLMLSRLTLSPVESLPTVSEVEIDMDGFGKLSEGNTVTLPENIEVDFTARVKMSDGTYKDLNGFAVDMFSTPRTAANDPDNAITAAVTGGSASFTQTSNFRDSYAMYATGGQFAGKIASASAGDSQLTVTAKVGGAAYTKTINIEVTDAPITYTGATPEAEVIFLGDSTYLIPETRFGDGTVLNNAFTETVFTSLTPDIAAVDASTGLLTAKGVGTARIEVKTTFNGVTVTGSAQVEILPMGLANIEISAGGSEYIRYTGIEGDTVPLYVRAISNTGDEIDIQMAEYVTAESLTPEIATVDGLLNITPVYADPDKGSEARFRVTVKIDGREMTRELSLLAVAGKSKSTYYTSDVLTGVRENVKSFSWASDTAETAMDGADFYVENLDAIYDLIHSEGLPRIRAIGVEADPNKNICKFCGKDLLEAYGNYPWLHNALQRPWQIQCPDCKRLFPSNDFGSFYELGLNEYGEFDHQRALDAHHRLIHHGSADAACSCEAPAAASEKERTREWYDYYGYGVKGGYLHNDLYGDVDKSETAIFREGERIETWGVDDGFGYIPLQADGTPYRLEGMKEDWTPERHTYIAEYLFHGLWRKGSTRDSSGGMVVQAFNVLTNAYYYSGDIKYGRALAVLTSRIADFYEDFDMSRYNYDAWRSSDTCQGKLLNHIWENSNAQRFARAYDITFDLYEDEYVLDYIREKGKTVKFRDAKETPSQIRTSIEDGVLRAGLYALTGEYAAEKGRALLGGNFGYPQEPNALLAVILDTMPDTAKWLDYLMAPGFNTSFNSQGGGIEERLVDVVDRDGQGNENSSYNVAWHTTLIEIADILVRYERYQTANFYNMPKFVRMFYANIPLISTYYTPEIGDSSSTLGKSQWVEEQAMTAGWKHLEDPIFAQVLYLLNGNKSKGLRYGIEERDPERLEDEVQEVIDTYGELSLSSDIMTGFGFAMLRDGGDYTSASAQTSTDTRRNVWMYFGSANGHGHKDTLNLGMTAFGLNFMPDNGYPEETGMQPNRLQWVESTLPHNTVMVNEKEGGENLPRSKTQHFADDGTVQLMDVDAPEVYKDVTDTYRRSVLMIKADDENSYAVDFFRILGGNDHLYSFHASSDEITETAGLEMTPQLNDEGTDYYGTYVGRKVEYKDPETGETKIFDPEAATKDPNSPQQWTYTTVFPRGYTWVDKVDRDKDPDEKFELDFKIKDFNKAIKNSSGLGLHMTMLDGGNRDGRDVEVATVNGYPPNKAANNNIPFFRYVFVKHSAKDENADLDTTFTTVFEPYRSERYIKAVDELAMTAVDGTEKAGDSHKAVRVEHTSGRVDYVLYSTNNSVTYEITLDDGATLRFRGFVGVYTMQNGENTYKYLHDGDILGEETGTKGAIEGIVVGFTQDMAFENEIVIKPNLTVSAEEAADLAGRIVVVENAASAYNGAYKIEGAEVRGGNVALDIGLVTTINAHKDALDYSKGYVYNIEIGQNARIPLSYREESNPVFTSTPDALTVSAGSSVSASVAAESPLDGVGITYRADVLPRGASFNADTATFTWRPDDSQAGDHHVAITAIDDSGRETTVHFNVTVYGRTTGSSGTATGDTTGDAGASSDNAVTDTSGIATSGGGGGSSGQGSTDGSDTGTDTDDQTNVGTDVPNGSSTDDGTSSGGADSNVRFIDLGNHAWAADAINSLADDGIIKGTTASTYSPANNTTRADYAILLVRAFELESDDTANFSDVNASDYFAAELAIARNTGIVNGIGDNKYAPRNTITRQDMMVIIYRALEKLGKLNDTANPVGRGLAPAEYPDYDTVADYAKPAVSYLISNGLVNGKNGRIAPLDYTTRAEVAVLLKRILDYVK